MPIIFLIFLVISPNNVYASNSDNSEILLSCNCVAFRLDDVNDSFANTHYEIINLFVEEEIPITLGIIGNRIGENTNLTDLIKENLNRNLELASHGWEHEKFPEYSLDEQINLMRLSSEKIFEVFGMKPKVFIPPYNRFNSNTFFAAQEIGFTHFSARIYDDTAKYPLQNQTFYQFPITTSTVSEVDEFGLWHMQSHDATWFMIKHTLSELGFAMVLMHPNEFAKIENGKHIDQIDIERLKDLKLLLADINVSDLKIVPIGRINLDSVEFSIPQWIKNNAAKWADGHDEDSLFMSVIQYMIKENIISIRNIPGESSENSENVPDWVRNNASWWAYDLISDDDFFLGIKYLLERGIIKV